MKRSGAVRVLTIVVGTVFVVVGLIEVTVQLRSSEGVDGSAVGFWAVTLIGGGALVLLGVLVLPETSWWRFIVIAIGCLLGSVATAWTVVLPIVALLVVYFAGRLMQRTPPIG